MIENEEQQAARREDEPTEVSMPGEETGAQAPTTEPAIEPLTPERIEELKDKARERDEIWERFLRMAAEYENRRKRMEQEHERRLRYAAQNVLADLLPALADLKRAARAGEKGTLESLLAGVKLVNERLAKALEKHGARPIPTVGEKFDPHWHEAVAAVESTEHPPSTVVEEVEPGWMLDDRVVLAAKVIVAVAPQARPAEQPPGSGR